MAPRRAFITPLRRLAVLALLVLLPGAPSIADVPMQTAESLEAAIIAFVEEQTSDHPDQVGIEVGYIDPRLRLTRCADTPVVFLPPGTALGGRSTVGLRCAEPESWTIYIPVSVQFRVEVVVTDGFLQRGRPVTADEVSLKAQDTSQLRSGYFRDLEDVIGMVPRTGIGPGTVLRPSQLDPPRLIRRGDRVSINAEADTFQIRMEGEALADGREGETIRVRNLSSGRELDAVVVAPGQVRVRGH